MSTASASKVDAVFGRWLDASELSSFHEKLLSNMTLQNVIRSITILDPERLFHEIESAVHELQRRTGEKIGSNARFELERMLDSKVNLKLWVKVKKDWRDSDFLLKNFGYKEKD